MTFVLDSWVHAFLVTTISRDNFRCNTINFYYKKYENKNDKSAVQKDTHIGVENFSETIQIIECVVPVLH